MSVALPPDAVAEIEATRRNGGSPDVAAYAPTDLGNAERFAHVNAATLRYVAERRSWLKWSGPRWAPDVTGEADRAAKEISRALLREAADAGEAAAKWAVKAQSEQRIRAMLTLASTEPEIVVSADELDADPWALSTPNGTLDLRTAELRPADPADLITLGTNVVYSPDAVAPRWEQFLAEIFEGDAELIGFVKRLIGYCLTGDTREHKMVVFHGGGRNGKSRLLEVLRWLLGGLSSTAAFDTFARARGDRGPRNDLARLHRARLVTASESGEGRQLDEATIKEVTGGDVIAARFLYGEHFEFKPQFKLILVTNHRPRVDGDDEAIWARLRLVPFDVSFEGREERDLGDKLKRELPGILRWAVEGCLEWQAHGLGEPEAVTAATAEYRADEDTVGTFLADRCALDGEVASAALREAYVTYCEGIGEKPLSAASIGRRLAKRGIDRSRRSGGKREWIYTGLRLR